MAPIHSIGTYTRREGHRANVNNVGHFGSSAKALLLSHPPSLLEGEGVLECPYGGLAKDPTQFGTSSQQHAQNESAWVSIMAGLGTHDYGEVRALSLGPAGRCMVPIHSIGTYTWREGHRANVRFWDILAQGQSPFCFPTPPPYWRVRECLKVCMAAWPQT